MTLLRSDTQQIPVAARDRVYMTHLRPALILVLIAPLIVLYFVPGNAYEGAEAGLWALDTPLCNA